MTSSILDKDDHLDAPHEKDKRRDTVTLLSIYVLLLMFCPSDQVFSPLGAAGEPANLLGASFLLVFGIRFFSSTPRSSRIPRGLRNAAILLLCSFLASYAAGNLRAMDTTARNGADRGLIMLAGWLGVLLLTADGVSSLERLTKLFGRVVACTTVVTLIGDLQFFSGKNLATYIKIPGLVVHNPYSNLVRGAYNRPQATAAHPLEFAFVLAAVLPIAIHRARHAPEDRRWVRWGQVAVIALTLVLSISRSAILALAVIAIVIMPVWSRRERRITLGLAALACAAILIAAPGVLAQAGHLIMGIGTDASTTSRTGAYSRAAPLISQHPLLGRGFGTFEPLVYFYTDNQYINSAIEVGLVGLVVIVALLITGWVTARQTRRVSSDPEIRHLAQCMAASVAVIMCDSASFDSLHYEMATGIIFLILGGIGALYRLASAGNGLVAQPQAFAVMEL